MKMECLDTRKVLFAAAGLLVLGTGVWSIMAFSRSRHNEHSAPKEYSAEPLIAESEGQQNKRVHSDVKRGNLTREQPHKLPYNMLTRKTIGARQLDEYFAATPRHRQAILDRHIDEMQASMHTKYRRTIQQKREHSNHETGHLQRGGNEKAIAGDGMSTPSAGFRTGHARDARVLSHSDSLPRQERRMLSESVDPDLKARAFAYCSALSQRMEQRGIKMKRGTAIQFGPPMRIKAQK